MRPEIYEGIAYLVETEVGTETVPADIVTLAIGAGEGIDADDARFAAACDALSTYLEGSEIDRIDCVSGVLARLSEPGYLDATPWSVYDSRAEALAGLIDLYCDGERFHVDTWFERDRASVVLTDALLGETVLEWWDDDVRQAVVDGFLDPKDWLGSAVAYASQIGLIEADSHD